MTAPDFFGPDTNPKKQGGGWSCVLFFKIFMYLFWSCESDGDTEEDCGGLTEPKRQCQWYGYFFSVQSVLKI